MTSSEIDTELKKKTLEAMQFIGSELSDGYAAGKAFVVEQAPVVVQELLRWSIFQNAFYVCVNLTMVLTYVFGVRWLIKHSEKVEGNDGAEVAAGFFIGGALVSLFCTVLGIGQFLSLVQALIAPRLFLIEQAKTFLK